MKKLFALLFIAPLLMATQCEEDNCNPSIKYKEKPNLITVENLQTTYNLGDIIWLSSTLDRNQSFESPSENIDLFNYPLDYCYDIQFTKISVYNPAINLCVNESTSEVTNGSLNYCNQIVYEKQSDSFKSRIGIKLLETGDYRLSIYNIATFRVNGLNCEDNGISINTTFSNNNEKLVNFTVQ